MAAAETGAIASGSAVSTGQRGVSRVLVVPSCPNLWPEENSTKRT